MPTTITVTADFIDAEETPLTGTVEFLPTAAILDAVGNLVVAQVPIVATVTAGAMSVDLVATDFTGAQPEGVTYQVTETLTGTRPRRRRYNIEVPAASAGGTADLADLAPVVDFDQTFTYVLRSEYAQLLDDMGETIIPDTTGVDDTKILAVNDEEPLGTEWTDKLNHLSLATAAFKHRPFVDTSHPDFSSLPVQDAVEAAAVASSGEVKGGSLYVPDVRTLDEALVIDQQALKIWGRGRGKDATTLAWAGSAGEHMINVLDSAYLEISDLTILGDGTNTPLSAIYYEMPSAATVGDNQRLALRRVNIGRYYQQELSPDGDVEVGLRIGGASNTNNDMYVVEDCDFFDCSDSGLKVENVQSIWGNLRNVRLDTCGYGIYTRGQIVAYNVLCNRNTDTDLYVGNDGQLHVLGYFSEHAPLLWDQQARSTLVIWGGKALLHAEMTGANWAQSVLSEGDFLDLGGGLLVRDDAASGDPVLRITGGSANTDPAYARIRGCKLPNGDTDAGYNVGAVTQTTVLTVDIEQGNYRRHQTFSGKAATQHTATVVLPSRVPLGHWFQDNVAASQTDVALNLQGGGRNVVFPMRAGSITGIKVRSNAARTAGTLTVEVTRSGSGVGLTAVLDGTNTTIATSTQDSALDTYSTSQSIGVKITTSGDWAPTTADIDVWVEGCLHAGAT